MVAVSSEANKYKHSEGANIVEILTSGYQALKWARKFYN
jgi:hypothetical protein